MADQNHIDWLREGVPAWNARRRARDFQPDLSEADLGGANLGGQTLELWYTLLCAQTIKAEQSIQIFPPQTI